MDEYYFDFLVDRVAHAVAQADAAARPAKLSVAIGSMPSNTQSCWSSYPFIDDQSMPVLQARAFAFFAGVAELDVTSSGAQLASWRRVPLRDDAPAGEA